MNFGIEYVLDTFLRPWLYADTWEQVREELAKKNREWWANNENKK